MENKKRMTKQLFVRKGYSKDGKEVNYGAVKIKLKTNYEGEIITVRNVLVNDRDNTVCNVMGVLPIHEMHQRIIKNAFDVELPLDSFLTVDVAIWDGRLSKFNLSENSRFMFFLSNMRLDTFERKDGTIGYKLVCTAYDFDVLYSGNNTKKDDASAEATAHQSDNSDEGAVEESDLYNSGDLPF